MLLGLLLKLRSPSGSIAFIVVLIFLLLFEGILHVAEHEFIKHGYKGLIQKLYKEFMIMGFISFGTMVYLDSVEYKRSDGFYAFEFAHLVLFAVAIVFVIQAGLLVWLAASRNKRLLKFASTSSIQLFAELKGLPYAGELRNFCFHHGLLILPYPSLRENIEYKIIEDFFIQSFNLPPEFNFANYLRLMLKNYVISLVDVRPMNWLLIAGLVVLNYGRLRASGGMYEQRTCKRSIVHHKQNGYNTVNFQNETFIGGHQVIAFGGGGDSSSGDSSKEIVPTVCVEYLLSYALFTLLAVMAYQCIVLFFSELYMRRLLNKVIDRQLKVEEEEKKQTDHTKLYGNEALNSSPAAGDGADDCINHCSAGGTPLTDYPPHLVPLNSKASRGTEIVEEKFDVLEDVNTGLVRIPVSSEDEPMDSLVLTSIYLGSGSNDDTNRDIEAGEAKNCEPSNNDLVKLSLPISEGSIRPEVNRFEDLSPGSHMESAILAKKRRINAIGSELREQKERQVTVMGLNDTEQRTRPSLTTTWMKWAPRGSLFMFFRGEYEPANEACERASVGRGSVLSMLVASHGRRHIYIRCLERINNAELAHHEVASQRSSIYSPSDDGSVIEAEDTNFTARRTSSKGRSMSVSEAPATSQAERSRSISVSAAQLRDRAIAMARSEEAQHEPEIDSDATATHIHIRRPKDCHSYDDDVETRPAGGQGHSKKLGRSYSEFFEQHESEPVNDSIFETVAHGFQRLVRLFSASSLLRGLHWMYALLMEHPGDPEHSSDKAIEQMQRDLGSIFLFRDPRAYFHAVELGLMMQCLYTAIWITNISYIATLSVHPYFWSCILSLPLIVNSLILRQTIYFACMLKSVSNLDESVSGKICEEAMDTRNVKSRLRKLFRTQLRKLDIDRVEWHDFVKAQYETFLPRGGRSKGLNFREMLSFVHSLQIHLTSKSMRNQFKVIDFDKDGYVRWRDLELIVFPEAAKLRKLKSTKRDSPGYSAHRLGRELSAYSLADKAGAANDFAPSGRVAANDYYDDDGNDRDDKGNDYVDVIREGSEDDSSDESSDESIDGSSDGGSDKDGEEFYRNKEFCGNESDGRYYSPYF